MGTSKGGSLCGRMMRDCSLSRAVVEMLTFLPDFFPIISPKLHTAACFCVSFFLQVSIYPIVYVYFYESFFFFISIA